MARHPSTGSAVRTLPAHALTLRAGREPRFSFKIYSVGSSSIRGSCHEYHIFLRVGPSPGIVYRADALECNRGGIPRKTVYRIECSSDYHEKRNIAAAGFRPNAASEEVVRG